MAEKKINGRSYRCEQMAASDGIFLAARIGNLAGPLLASLENIGMSVFDLRNIGNTNEAEAVKAIAVIGKFLEKLDPKESRDLIVELCEKASIQSQSGNYEPIIFDAHFQGKHMADCIAVTAWVFQVNFANFFKELIPSHTKEMAKMPGG